MHAIKKNIPVQRATSNLSGERVFESWAPRGTSRSLDTNYLRASIFYTLLLLLAVSRLTRTFSCAYAYACVSFVCLFVCLH